MTKSELVEQIAASLQNNFNDWEFDAYVATHKPSGLTLWNATGGVSVYRPFRLKFNLIQKIYLKSVIEDCKIFKAHSLLKTKGK